jgi:hypothetical protein
MQNYTYSQTVLSFSFLSNEFHFRDDLLIIYGLIQRQIAHKGLLEFSFIWSVIFILLDHCSAKDCWILLENVWLPKDHVRKPERLIYMDFCPVHLMKNNSMKCFFCCRIASSVWWILTGT